MYSFKDWCIDNNLNEWLELWDYELNDKLPDEVSYRANQYCYFKCKDGLHTSESKLLTNLARSTNMNNLFCRQCKSFGKWLIDTYGECGIEMLWSDKNTISPFSVYTHSRTTIYLRCLSGAHDDYPTRPCDFVRYESCPICHNKRVLRGFNDIATTHPHLVKYFNNIEDAYTHVAGSEAKVDIKCPICGQVKNMMISDLVNDKYHCPLCDDGISFANKFILCFLNQALEKHNIKFYFEKVFDWSRNLSVYKNDNSENRRYDFYIEYDGGVIIEAHGLQHYACGFGSFDGGKTLDEQIQNDLLKKQLALSNGIKESHYIVLDCRYSTLDHIRKSIDDSNLSKIFDFCSSEIDWDLCVQMAMKSNVSRVAELWNDGVRCYTKLAECLRVARNTIYEYLETAASIGLCDYVAKPKSIMKSKPIICENNGYVFASAKDFEVNSERIFGRFISRSYVYNVVRKHKKQNQDVIIRQISYEEFIDTQIKHPNNIFGDIVLFGK